MSWQLAVIGIVAVLGILGVIVYFARRAGSQEAKGAVSGTQLGQIAETQNIEEKAEEVGRAQPKTARALRDWLRSGKP